jgi:E3 ubiquitin-protein ligase DOA10
MKKKLLRIKNYPNLVNVICTFDDHLVYILWSFGILFMFWYVVTIKSGNSAATDMVNNPNS